MHWLLVHNQIYSLTITTSYLIIMCTVNSQLYKPMSHMEWKECTVLAHASSISVYTRVNAANQYTP